MLKKIQISGGFGSVEGLATHFKLVSANAPVRVTATGKNGKIELSTEMRAPMAVEFGGEVARIEFTSSTDQLIEIWYSTQPLEYLQLTAVGASRMEATAKLAYAGVTELLPANPRKSVKLLAESNLILGENAAGWPLAAGVVQEFETVGAVNCYIEKPPFDVSLVGDTENIATAVAIANPHQFERFAGKTYAATQTYQLATITDAGVVTDITGSTGLAKVGMIKAFNGALYVAGQMAGGGVGLFKSLNGTSFAKVAEKLDGTLLGAAPYKTHFYRGVISAPFYTSHYVVCDLIKETIDTRLQRNPNTSRDCMSNGVDDFEVANQGVWRRAANNPLGDFELIASGDWRNGTISENTGLVLAVSSANSKVSQIEPDGTVNIISGTNVSSATLNSNYFNAGVDAWKSGTTVLFFVDGAEYSKTVTSNLTTYANPRYDAAAGAVYWLTSSPTNNTLFRLPLGQQVAIDPVKVNALEFII